MTKFIQSLKAKQAQGNVQQLILILESLILRLNWKSLDWVFKNTLGGRHYSLAQSNLFYNEIVKN